MSSYTWLLLTLMVVATFECALCGTWLSFSTSHNPRRSKVMTELANLADGSADRLALSNSGSIPPNGGPGRPMEADPLEVLLSSCSENYMTRAQRSEAPKSDVLRLCKALLESMQQ